MKNRWQRILRLSVAIAVALLAFAPAAALGQTYTDLHDFTVAEGDGSVIPSMPQVLAQGRDGNLYGTQSHGGANGVGTVFRMTPAGAITVIHNFAITDGAYPYSGLTLGTDGNFYGTTYSGGTFNYGTVFKITPGGTLTTLYHFDGLANRFYPFAGVVQGKNGAFYGITLYGAVYSVTASGKFKALNNGVGGNPYAPLTLANDGSFYGTTFNGGASGFGNVFRVSAAGAFKNLYSFDLTHGYHPLGPLVQGADGQLYGTAAAYGLHNGGVAFKVTLKGHSPSSMISTPRLRGRDLLPNPA